VPGPLVWCLLWVSKSSQTFLSHLGLQIHRGDLLVFSLVTSCPGTWLNTLFLPQMCHAPLSDARCSHVYVFALVILSPLCTPSLNCSHPSYLQGTYSKTPMYAQTTNSIHHIYIYMYINILPWLCISVIKFNL
jgi:hypothetical protein